MGQASLLRQIIHQRGLTHSIAPARKLPRFNAWYNPPASSARGGLGIDLAPRCGQNRSVTYSESKSKRPDPFDRSQILSRPDNDSDFTCLTTLAPCRLTEISLFVPNDQRCPAMRRNSPDIWRFQTVQPEWHRSKPLIDQYWVNQH